MTQTRQPPLVRQGRLQLPTEVLDIIVAHLTRHDLLAVSRVCKSWRPSACHQLWKNIDALPLNCDFLRLLPTQGHLTHRLDLILHARSKLEGKPHELLAQVLQDTPRLQHLCIHIIGHESDEFLQPTFAAIRTYVGGSLTSLGLKGMAYTMQSETAAKEFFSCLSRLTRFEMDGPAFQDLDIILDSLPLLTAIAFKGDRFQPRRAETIGNLGLQSIGAKLPLLRELSIHFSENINGRGLANFSRSCPRLTRVDLRGCQGMVGHEIEHFLSAQPHLTHVSLADTNLSDSALLILATPARAGQLRVLNVRKCLSIHTHGVGQIIAACTNLQELNFSLCFGVWMDVFAFNWACLGLLRLNFGGIHGSIPGPDGSDTYLKGVVLEKDLENMYTQLGRLRLLVELTLLPLPFHPRLFEMGRVSIENMTRLEHLSVLDWECSLEERDVIWLATRLPSLRTLDMADHVIDGGLLLSLLAINQSLKINTLKSHNYYGIHDSELQGTNADITDEMNSDDDDNDDSDGNNENDSHYSPGEEPYQPAHPSVDEESDDSADIYPYTYSLSNSDEYNTYDESDNSDDNSDYGYSWAYWPGYRDPDPYYSSTDENNPYYVKPGDDNSQGSSQEDSEENSEKDSEDSEEEDSEEEGSEEENSEEEDSQEENSDKADSEEGDSEEVEIGSDIDSDEGEDQDGNSQVESDAASENGTSGDEDDDQSLSEGEHSDEVVSEDEDETNSEVESTDDDDDDEIEESEEEQYSEEYSEEEVEEEEEEYYSDEQEETGEVEYSEVYDGAHYDDYRDYGDDGSADSEGLESNGGYSSDDYY
ncbi:hypothetical protein EC991_004018 [Linnemannia zychae]|nr:hypothetical protein EC991_004018 [Linnemannia zychae]